MTPTSADPPEVTLVSPSWHPGGTPCHPPQPDRLQPVLSRPCWLGRIGSEDDGSTTVAAALLIAAFVALTLVAATAGVNVVKARQAAVAADLSAVAGAVAAQQGDDGCAAASEIATANQSRMVSCRIIDEDVQVSIERRDTVATSRAGPAS